MSEFFQKLKDSDNSFKLGLAVFVGLVVFIIYQCFYNEAFATVAQPREFSQDDLMIRPPYFNPDTRTIMAGSGFIPQEDIIPAWGANYGLTDDLDDGAGGNMGLHYNLCSPACCSAQYPTPHKLDADPLVCGSEDSFAPSPLTCNNAWQNSGCACIKKDQLAFLSNRGGNTA